LWCSDVTPFDYMKAMAELWGRGGQDFATAQQNFLAGMAKAAGQEAAPGFPSAAMLDPQGMDQANQAFTKLWSAALEISQTIGRTLQTGEDRNPAVAELLGKIFDPRAWFSGTDTMDQALQKMAEGPRLADLWDTERKMLTLFNTWSALRRRSVEHQTVMLEAWMQAAGTFAKDLNAKAARDESVGSWREVLALWVDTANAALLETQRSDAYLASQREMLKASTDLRIAQQEMAAFYSEMFGYPTREELDDVHRTVTELRREVRALRREKRIVPKNGKAATKPADHSWDQADPNRSTSS
jgi:class III poly(R)-hydroxyalkanoic acid synthase PhaE subunit